MTHCYQVLRNIIFRGDTSVCDVIARNDVVALSAMMWVSIPENMAVPKPLVKRTFDGGLYAAHMIKMGDFDHWILLKNWVMNNDKYEHDWHSVRCTPYEKDMDRCFEEQLNYWGNIQKPEFRSEDMQLDLLFPIKEKTCGGK